MTWYLIGSLAALLTSFGFVPQMVKMWRTRSVKDISLLTLGQLALGVSLWTVYGVHLRDPIIIAANMISLATLLLGFLLYRRYSARKRT
ncbi:MAG: SemiSWEET family transporter [Dehalococcoidia bacterium]|nr:SemiSWEET family transporter [Dehalococcoidia bacterium]